MRISGMATGMDIEQIVGDLMKAQRLPVDKLLQSKQTIQWKLDGYREINRKFDTFRNNIFDGVMRQANMLAKRVTSSNENIITATSNSSAGNISLRISQVSQLAKAASYNSTDRVTTSGEKLNMSGTLGAEADKFANGIDWKEGVVHSKTVQAGGSDVVDLELDGKQLIDRDNAVIQVDGKTYKVVSDVAQEDLADNEVLLSEDGKLTFKEALKQNASVQAKFMTESDSKTFTLSDEEGSPRAFQLGVGGLKEGSINIKVGGADFDGEIFTDRDAFNASTDGNKVFVDLNSGRVEFGKDVQTDTEIEVEYKQNYTTAGIKSFNDNGEEVHSNFVFTSNQSMTQVFNELNRSSAKVAAFYDEYTGKVNVTRTETGIFNENGAELSFSGFFANELNLSSDGNENGGAQNAKLTVNGLETERRTNTFTISGMTVTLKAKTDEEVTLGSSTDTDKVFDTIKKFVDEYNELIDFVNGKITEDRNRDFSPLTDEERQAMSDKDIELWEEKAMSGLFRNDQTLRTPMDRLRTDVYGAVNGDLATEFRHLSAIGITTSKDYMAGGRLEINEEKLRAAIEEDAEGVYQLFAADGEANGEKGIGRRMRDTLDSAITSVADRAGGFRGKTTNQQFALGRELDSIEKRISNFERRLQQVEQRYWRQFNAMEAAVQRANQQGEMMYAQLFGGMQ